tara:strand:- start:289 stop:597 length:309 start_codon:yes stop_codon:yes gene_type:complete
MRCNSCETFGNTKEPENTKKPFTKEHREKIDRTRKHREKIVARKYFMEQVKIILSALCIGIIGFYSSRKKMAPAIFCAVSFLIIAIILNRSYRAFFPIRHHN